MLDEKTFYIARQDQEMNYKYPVISTWRRMSKIEVSKDLAPERISNWREFRLMPCAKLRQVIYFQGFFEKRIVKGLWFAKP